MSIYSGFRMLLVLFTILAIGTVKGQHYLFIEADGQQPFYFKTGATMRSSSASGFLIVPKITSNDVEFSIGFPKNIHPEVRFYISGTDKDRGFQLKRMEGKGWSLFDRFSLEIIQGDTAALAPTELQLAPKDGGSFASMLSIAADDKSLLTPTASKNIPVKPLATKVDPTDPVKSITPINNPAKPVPAKEDPTDLAKTITPKNNPTKLVSAKEDVVDPAPPVTVNPIIKDSLVKASNLRLSSIVVTQTENNDTKRIVYLEQSAGGKTDTILVEIDKVSREIVPEKSNNTPITRGNLVVLCDRPFGDYKAIRSLQKKLLGLDLLEDQYNYAVKVFSQKCFNTKQALEIGWLFVDEKSRLKLFTLLKPLISDQTAFSTLESTFLKEDNINAFRALMLEGN